MHKLRNLLGLVPLLFTLCRSTIALIYSVVIVLAVAMRSKLGMIGSLVGALVLSLVVAASASAYLHVADATNYARAHVYASSFCNSSPSICPTYPWGTGWYDRISDSYVRVEIAVNRNGSGHCTRVFAVHGSDSNPYISTDGSSPYYYCT